MAGNDRKLSSFDEMGYDNSTKVLIPALKYSSNDPNALIENRNIPLELFYKQPLFKYDWYEYLLNDPNWIRCDTFSWHSGDSQEANSYEKVYQHLVDDIDGKTLQSETVAGITIQYYEADDTHKICPASEETNILNLYNSIGVAWYYILDTVNQRFKLPRINPAKKELLILPETLGVRGNGKTLTWYDNYGNSWGTMSDTSADYNIQLAGAGSVGSNVGSGTYASVNAGRRYYAIGITPDVEKSGLVADLSAISRVFSGKKYLYCYVGGFTQTSLENIAGQNMSIVNEKADRNLLNVSNNDFSLAIERSGKIYVKEAYINGTSGYIVLSNNLCKQWGTTRSQNTRINFLKKPYKDLPCMTWGFVSTRNGASYDREIHYYAVDKNGFTTGTRIIAGESPAPSFMWEAIGELEV